MWARIENGTVREVIDFDPAGKFHPSLIWIPCGSDVRSGWDYNGTVFSPPAPPGPTVPESVTMRQGRLAMLEAGILSQVEAAIAAMTGDEGEAARIEWEYSRDLRRDHPLLNTLASTLGLTNTQIDAIFVSAATK